MRATAKSVKVSTRKVRLVADMIRNKTVKEAVKTLSLTKKHGSYVLLKAVHSATSNAIANNKTEADKLVIDQLIVNEGQFLKRYHMSTRGRVHPYKKRTTHITVILGEKPKLEEEKKEAKNMEGGNK